MTPVRKTVVALFLVVGALGLLPVVAAAATSDYKDPVVGAEVYATSSEGVFVGIASGGLPGAWSADVKHTDLATLPATITSGSFSLVTVLNKQIAVVAGSFKTGGSIALVSPPNSCGIQKFMVTDALSNVGVGSTPTGTGSFSALLTHFRTKIFGKCVTYAATVAGSVSLTF